MSLNRHFESQLVKRREREMGLAMGIGKVHG